jgi:hypothetical protein
MRTGKPVPTPRAAIHLSWVWRDSPDVASNHDLCYARSADGGRTWSRSTGEPYTSPSPPRRPSTLARIPQNHELINQTSMTADAAGRAVHRDILPPEGTEVPQYQLIYRDGTGWHIQQVGELKTPFRLGGGGTKRNPISRPQILSA